MYPDILELATLEGKVDRIQEMCEDVDDWQSWREKMQTWEEYKDWKSRVFEVRYNYF